MGRLQANEMIARMPEHEALVWHIRYNCYPAIPAEMLPVCKAAIHAARHGDAEREMVLPDMVRYHGKRYAPAHAIIEYAHLDVFVEEVEP